MFYKLFSVSNSDSDDATFFSEGILKIQVRIPYGESNASPLSTSVFGVANASTISCEIDLRNLVYVYKVA